MQEYSRTVSQRSGTAKPVKIWDTEYDEHDDDTA